MKNKIMLITTFFLVFALFFISCSGDSLFNEMTTSGTTTGNQPIVDITEFGDGSGGGTGTTTLTDNGDGTFTQSDTGVIYIPSTEGWTDYIIELDALVVNNGGNNGYGVYFRMQTNYSQTTPNGYVFQIDFGVGSSGGYRAVKFPGDSSIVADRECLPGETVNPHCISGDHHSYDVWHHVVVVVEGNHFLCYVDGYLIYDFTDSSFSSGGAGIRTWSGGNVVKFKNLSVTQIN